MGIDSVVHLAGILRDSFVRTLTVESIREVFSPKAGAALTLHRVTSLRPLRAMIYSSSVSGALGNVGQYAYAAASAFLDSMARDRRIRGNPCRERAIASCFRGRHGGVCVAHSGRRGLVYHS